MLQAADWLILAAAGFLGGLRNAVAGGGSFFTLPALMYVGVPPLMANATGTTVLLPGYIASAWRFRRDLRWPEQLGRSVAVGLILLGGSAGALLLLMTGDAAFERLIPWLILFATLWFALGPRLVGRQKAALSRGVSAGVLIAVCVYGGYFNGGLGVVLLAAFAYMGFTSLVTMNGLKNVASALLTSIAVLVYWWGGAIAWQSTAWMMVFSVIGGYAGAAWSYRVSQAALRGFITASGLLISVIFFIRLAS